MVTRTEPQASPGSRLGLEAMLWADTVAVVGASPRPLSLGRRVMAELVGGGFGGQVIPVTPNHPEVMGLPAAGTLGEVQGPIDLAILAVADGRLEEQLAAAIDQRVGAVVVFSPAVGHAEDPVLLRDRLGGMAREAGVALCGPNGMGFLNLEHRLRVTGFYQPPDLRQGPISFISHSGSLFSAMLHNRRQIEFNIVVSTGIEIVTTMDQYLEHVLTLPTTRAVGLFLEMVRRPEAMAAALDRAWNLDVPVVALKVGRTPAARRAAATHSGALAGEDAAYDAFFSAHHVHRVDTMEEMADTLGIFGAGVRARPGALGAVHDSGGERSLLLDTAAATGVELAIVGDATRSRLSAVLEPGLEPENPVDAWGTGHGHDAIFEEALRALGDDPAVGVVAFCVDLTPEEDPAEGYGPLLERIGPSLPVPLVVMGNLVSGIDPAASAELRSIGIPVLEGTLTGLEAVGHLLDRAEWRGRPPLIAPPGVGTEVRRRWRERLATGVALGEAEALALLADYGIEVVEHRLARSAEEARDAAAALGWPVVLKSHSGHGHKTEVDGVRLGLGDRFAVEDAYCDLAARLGPEVIVQPLVVGGVELALGIFNDDQFGPVVVVGAGGRLVEVIDDRLLTLPPVDETGARRLLAGLRVSPLLDGLRGSPPSDRTAVARAISAMASLAADLGDLVEGLDVNPLIAHPDGAVAVDALVVPRRPM